MFKIANSSSNIVSKKTIGLTFGVAGGSNINGTTGEILKSQLNELIKNLNDKNTFKIKISLDKKLVEKEIKAQMDDILKNLSKYTGGKPSGRSGSYTRERNSIESKLFSISNNRLPAMLRNGTISSENNDSFRKQLGDISKLVSDGSIKEASVELKKLEQELANVKNKWLDTKKIVSGNIGFGKLALNAETFMEKYKSTLSPKSISKINEYINSLKGDKSTYKDVSDAKRKWLEIEDSIRNAGETAETIGQKIKRVFSEKLGFGIIATAAMYARQVIRQVYQDVVALDAEVVNLQIASGKSRKEVQSMVNDYFHLAQSLGVTTVAVAQSADTWLRQGYNEKEALDLIAASQKLAVLGQMDNAEAATALTSVMKGYQLQAEDVISVVDKLVKVDMEAAASAGGIATAMAETNTSAKLAGVSIDTLIGYMATIKEVTQDADESVGTFFKTLTARAYNIKSGLLKDPETDEDLSDVEKTLTGLGISLRSSNDEFRNLEDVLGEVSSRWGEFSNVQQRAIAKAFGGTRQQEKFLVLMENYGTAMKYAEDATNSFGTTEEKYTAWMTSIQAAQNSFKASFEELSTNILNSDFVVKIVNGSSILLRFINFVVENKAILLAIISAALAFVKSIKGQSIASPLNLVAGYIAKIATKLPIASGGFSALTKAIGTNMLVMGKYLLIIAAVDGALHGLKALNDHVLTDKASVKSLGENSENYKSYTSELESLNSELKTAKDRMAELEFKSKNGTITLVEASELQKLKESNILLKDQIELYKGKADIASKDAQEDFVDIMGKANRMHEGSYDYVNNKANIYSGISQIYDAINRGELDVASDKIEKFREALIELYEAGYTYGTNSEVDEYIDQISDLRYKFYAAQHDTDKFLDLLSSDIRFSASFENFAKLAQAGKLTLSDFEDLGDKGEELLSILKLLNPEITDDEELVNQFSLIFKKLADKTKLANDELSEMDDLLKTISSVSDAYEAVGKAYKEFSDGGKVNISTLSSLNEKFKDSVKNVDEFITAIGTASTVDEMNKALTGLYEAYLNSADVYELLISGNKELVVAQLEELGVVNAEEVAENKLAIAKALSIESSVTQASSEQQLIAALKTEAIQSGLTGQAVNAFAYQKALAANSNFVEMTTAEVNSLLALASSAGVAGKQLEILSRISKYRSLMDNAQESIDNAKTQKDKNKYARDKDKYQSWIETAEKELDLNPSVGTFETYIAPAPVSTYGSSSKGSSSSSNDKDKAEKEKAEKEKEEKYKKEFDDWYDKLKYKLETGQITEETFLKKLDKKYKSYYKNRKKYDEEYRKYNLEVFNGLKGLYKDDLEAQKESFEESKEYWEGRKDYWEDKIKSIEEARDKELKALDEVYEANKKSLKSEKDNADYKKEQSEKRNSVSKLEAQIAQLEKDSSASAQKKVLELREQLTKAQDSLQEFENEHAYEQQLLILEEEQIKQEAEINKQYQTKIDAANTHIENAVNKISSIDEKIASVDKKINDVNDSSKKTFDIIKAWAKKQGVNIKSAYASGTSSAYGGWAKTQEAGSELISKRLNDGSFATFLPQGSKVFSAKATDFLYSLANSPLATLKQVATGIIPTGLSGGNNGAVVVTVGDINIEGNADKQTVTALENVRKDLAYEVLAQLKKVKYW